MLEGHSPVHRMLPWAQMLGYGRGLLSVTIRCHDHYFLGLHFGSVQISPLDVIISAWHCELEAALQNPNPQPLTLIYDLVDKAQNPEIPNPKPFPQTLNHQP